LYFGELCIHRGFRETIVNEKFVNGKPRWDNKARPEAVDETPMQRIHLIYSKSDFVFWRIVQTSAFPGIIFNEKFVSGKPRWDNNLLLLATTPTIG
jgi:hypothetical protein